MLRVPGLFVVDDLIAVAFEDDQSSGLRRTTVLPDVVVVRSDQDAQLGVAR
jgi:hypothetical protein